MDRVFADLDVAVFSLRESHLLQHPPDPFANSRHDRNLIQFFALCIQRANHLLDETNSGFRKERFVALFADENRHIVDD